MTPSLPLSENQIVGIISSSKRKNKPITGLILRTSEHRISAYYTVVVISELNEYHLILRVLFSCFKPPTVITSLARSLACSLGYYGERFKTQK